MRALNALRGLIRGSGANLHRLAVDDLGPGLYDLDPMLLEQGSNACGELAHDAGFPGQGGGQVQRDLAAAYAQHRAPLGLFGGLPPEPRVDRDVPYATLRHSGLV